MRPLDELHNPETPAARLSEIAAAHPELHALVARHPNVYSELLDWIATYGDENARAAVAQARAAVVAVPPAAGQPGGANEIFPGRAPGGARLTTPMIAVGVVGLLVVAVAVVVPVALLNQGGAAASSVSVAEHLSAPTPGAWQLASPYDEEYDGDTDVWVEAVTVSQNRALLLWSATENIDEPDSRTLPEWLQLIDTSNGSSIWLAEAPKGGIGSTSDITVAPGARHAVVSSSDRPLRIDLGDGSVTRLDVEGYILAAPEGAGGDIIVQGEDGVERFSLASNSTVWELEDIGRLQGLTDELLFTEEAVYRISDGRELHWQPSSNSHYLGVGAALLAYHRDSDGSLSGVDPATGELRWSERISIDAAPIPVPESTLLLLLDVDETVALDAVTGETRWRIARGITKDNYAYAVEPGAGVAMLPLTGSRSTSALVDLETGEILGEVEVSENGDWWREAIGVGGHTMYLAGGKEATLRAIDTRSGAIVWELDNLYANWYSFRLLGGQLVALKTGQAWDREDREEGRFRVVGIG